MVISFSLITDLQIFISQVSELFPPKKRSIFNFGFDVS